MDERKKRGGGKRLEVTFRVVRSEEKRAEIRVFDESRCCSNIARRKNVLH